jgi:SAM-dependent methyltransferase
VSDVFGAQYAAAYDALYGDKDYGAECDLIERVARDLLDEPLGSVLDLGCGTGGHALELARRGARVVGVDRSAAMLESARAKAGAAGLAAEFVEADVRSVDLSRTFDAVLMMFALLGYQLSNEEVLATLRSARAHVRIGGVVIFDVWYGPAVLAVRPSDRVKVVSSGARRIVRAASGELDTATHTARVHYRLWTMFADAPATETEEEHRVRYFFPLELALLLHTAGLELVRISSFDGADRMPDETTWNVLVVARPIGA